jgi:hypothetical protein
VRQGQTPPGQPRSRCRETSGPGGTCLLDSSSPGQSPHITEQIVDMAMQASGIRETARVWPVRPTPVSKALPKRPLGSTQCIVPSGHTGLPSPWRGRDGVRTSWRDVVGGPQRVTQWGSLWPSKRIRDGCGTPWILTPGRAGPRCSDGARPRFFYGCRPCCSRLASHGMPRTTGGPPSAMGPQRNTP